MRKKKKYIVVLMALVSIMMSIPVAHAAEHRGVCPAGGKFINGAEVTKQANNTKAYFHTIGSSYALGNPNKSWVALSFLVDGVGGYYVNATTFARLPDETTIRPGYMGSLASQRITGLRGEAKNDEDYPNSTYNAFYYAAS